MGQEPNNMDQIKNAAVLYADLDNTSIGTKSKIAQTIAGKSILAHTVERLGNTKKISEICVFCPSEQKIEIEKLVENQNKTVVIGLNEKVPPNKYLQRRKWGIDCWRGGLHEATVFDELNFNIEMLLALQQRGVTTIAITPAEAVLVDPQLVDGVIGHHHDNGETMRFTFAQAPPGLACCVYRIDLAAGVINANAHIGDLLCYNPDEPRSDPINDECAFRLDQQICVSPFRFIADTQRAIERIEQIAKQNNGDIKKLTANDIVNIANDRSFDVGKLPAELEIEINTAESLRMPNYPHGKISPQRGPMTIEQFAKIIDDCRDYDDIRLTIGGCGEPLAHSQLHKMIEIAKNAGIFAINIETDGRLLNGPVAEKLLEGPTDIISVFIDADEPKLYQKLKGEDCFGEVIENVESFIDKSSPVCGPLVVPHMVKSRQTVGQMEAFYDRWIRKCGAAVIEGHNDFAGQIESEEVMNMAPPARNACRRPLQIMNITADGNVAMCRQDFNGKTSIGNAFEKSVTQLWLSEKTQKLRDEHAEGQFDGNELCARCKEWHR